MMSSHYPPMFYIALAALLAAILVEILVAWRSPSWQRHADSWALATMLVCTGYISFEAFRQGDEWVGAVYLVAVGFVVATIVCVVRRERSKTRDRIDPDETQQYFGVDRSQER